MAIVNWWINESGKNALLTLPTELISDFVFRIPVARTDFNNAYRLLTDDQKAILDEALLPFSSRMKTYMVDVKDQEDLRQSNWNKTGIRTTGPHGGKRRGGNR